MSEQMMQGALGGGLTGQPAGTTPIGGAPGFGNQPNQPGNQPGFGNQPITPVQPVQPQNPAPQQ